MFHPALTTSASERRKTQRFSYFAGFAARERMREAKPVKLKKVAFSHFFDTLRRGQQRPHLFMQPVPLVQRLRRSGFRRPSGPAAPRRIPSEGARKKAASRQNAILAAGLPVQQGPPPGPGGAETPVGNGRRNAPLPLPPGLRERALAGGRGRAPPGSGFPWRKNKDRRIAQSAGAVLGFKRQGGGPHSGAGPSCTGAAPPMRAARLASAAATASARSCSRATRSFWSISLASSGLSFRKLRAFSRP